MSFASRRLALFQRIQSGVNRKVVPQLRKKIKNWLKFFQGPDQFDGISFTIRYDARKAQRVYQSIARDVFESEQSRLDFIQPRQSLSTGFVDFGGRSTFEQKISRPKSD